MIFASRARAERARGKAPNGAPQYRATRKASTGIQHRQS